MTEGETIGLASAVSAIFTAVLAGAVLIINALHKNTQEKRAVAFTEQGTIIDRQEKQIARLEAQVHQQQGLIGRMLEQNAESREEIAGLREYLKGQSLVLQKAGIDHSPPPDPPKPSIVAQLDDVAFAARGSAQNTALLEGVDEKLKSPNGGESPDEKGDSEHPGN